MNDRALAVLAVLGDLRAGEIDFAQATKEIDQIYEYYRSGMDGDKGSINLPAGGAQPPCSENVWSQQNAISSDELHEAESISDFALRVAGQLTRCVTAPPGVDPNMAMIQIHAAVIETELRRWLRV